MEGIEEIYGRNLVLLSRAEVISTLLFVFRLTLLTMDSVMFYHIFSVKQD